MEAAAWVEKFQLHAALVVLQLAFAGFEILTRNVLIGGFSPFVFPVYRNAIAFVVLAPLAFFIERNDRPRPEMRQIPMFLITGSIGIFFNQIAYILGLRCTSASFTSAYRNSLPVFTFLLAYFIGLEKLDIRQREGQAKLLGTGLGVSGALIMLLYRGPDVLGPSKLGNALVLHGFHFSTWQLGVVILTAAFLSFAVFLILQAQLLKTYPAPLSIASISIGIGCVELAILAAVVEPNLQRWKLNSSSAVTVVYAGLVASGLVSAIQSWGVKKGGPVIVAAYQPLETVAVGVLSFMFLREGFGLGSLLGALVVICGLYLLIWAQSKQREKPEESYLESLLAKDEENPIAEPA